VSRLPAPTSRAETAQALACLAPVGTLLAGVLHGVPTHTSAAAGWILLTALPAVMLAAARRRDFVLRGLAGALVLLLLALLHILRRGDLDTFEAQRALVSLSGWLALLLGGASLGRTGRRVLARGLLLLSALGLGFAWIDTLRDPVRALSGALENSGDLSETLLPGALLGLALARSERGAWRIVGLSTAAAFLITVGRAPVIAGGLSFLAAASLYTVFGSHGQRKLRAGAWIAALITFGATFLVSHRPADSSAAPASVSSATVQTDLDATLGGMGFRRLTWARVPAMVADHPWIGVGPGQFPRTFPTYRDPREIEISSHGRSSPTSTEVEHAHNDWLEAFAEYGVIGGSAWLMFGLLIAARALGVLSGRHGANGANGDSAQDAFALASLGVLANACFNSPHLAGPAFASAAPVLGVLLARSTPAPARNIRTTLVLLAAVVLAIVQAPQAWRFVRHGAALRPLTGAATVMVDGKRVHDAKAKAEALEQALAACPDSTVARVEQADLKRSLGAPAERQLALWQALLELRPYHLEALMAVANLHARAERFELAKASYAAAERVDPNNPQLSRNTLLLALRAGDVDGVLAGLARESQRGSLDLGWLERCAAEMLLSGRPHLGLPLLERARPELQVTSAESAYALASSLAEDPQRKLIADALLAHAHFSWAREHASAGDAASAVRSYRQCLRIADSYPDLRGAARRIRLELAAAESLRGSDHGEAPWPELNPVQESELPDWALEELQRLGWPGSRRR
jgi:tetratricopeptide (TPR) repeat protein